MLVLSRKNEETIVLPTVPAIIKVISAHSGQVRLGIDAPPHVPILREELAKKKQLPPVSNQVETTSSQEPREWPQAHQVRNRINNLTLGLALLRIHLGKMDFSVRETITGIEDELKTLRRELLTETEDSALPVGTISQVGRS